MADVMVQLEKLLADLGEGGKIDVGAIYLDAVKQTIDEEKDAYVEALKRDAPGRTGGLVNSITVTKTDTETAYGYDIEFAGEAPNGEPYEKIAKIQNFGSPETHIKPTFFISKAQAKLKNLDKRILKRALDELDRKRRE